MSTATGACPKCQASRAPDATFCWQCYAKFPAAGAAVPFSAPPGSGNPFPPAPAPVPVGVGAAVPMAGAAVDPQAVAVAGAAVEPSPPVPTVTDSTASETPLPAPVPSPPVIPPDVGAALAFGGPAGPNPYASPDGGPPLKPVGSTRGGGLGDVSSAAKWLAGLLAGLIGAGAVWWFTRGPDVTLPDQIAGVQQVENPGFEAFADTLADQINTSGSGASYGIGTDVDFAVMAFAGHDEVPPDQRMYDVAAAPASGVTVNASKTESFRARDSDFACAPFAGVVRGIVCLWRDGDTVGIVYDYNARKLRPARQLSVGVYEAVRL